MLDATTGQNAIAQVDAFKNTAALTGLIMTKLDGTAKGGILVALAAKFGLRFILLALAKARTICKSSMPRISPKS
ncbi:MAG: hypothetical protein WDM89_16205 [Rhizomicrobium sp.]